MGLNYIDLPNQNTQPDDPKLMEANVKFHELTHRQQMFILLYLGECAFNATEAYVKAGYKGFGSDPTRTRHTASVNANIIKTNPRVKCVIDAYLEAEMMAAKEHAFHLTQMARNVPQGPAFFLDKVEVEEFNSEGDVITVERFRLNWAKVQQYGYLIKSIKFDPYGQPIIEFHDRLRALDMIGRQHLNLGNNATDLNIKNEVNVSTGLVILPSKDDGGVIPGEYDEVTEEERDDPKAIGNGKLNGRHKTDT